MNISEEDFIWLNENYPSLSIQTEKGRNVLEGTLEFTVCYDKKTSNYIINPVECADDKYLISDKYKIRIIIDQNSEKFPKVKEIGNRIISFANKNNIDLIDLHTYEDSTCCLLGPLDEREITNIRDLLDRAILQFFYDESFYEKYRKWPRGQYSHGILGIIENYYDQNPTNNISICDDCIILLKKHKDLSRIEKILKSKTQIKSHHQCLCGSGNKYRDCHKKVFKGLWNLQKCQIIS